MPLTLFSYTFFFSGILLKNIFSALQGLPNALLEHVDPPLAQYDKRYTFSYMIRNSLQNISSSFAELRINRVILRVRMKTTRENLEKDK